MAKKRERALTPEEFREKQIKDYTPCWIHSEILFGTQLYPVAESFKKQITLLFLLDVADFTSERIYEQLKIWYQRYTKLNWTGVIVFQQKYAFLKNTKFFERYKGQAVLIDPYGELFERFGSQKEPVAVILKNGQLVTSTHLLPNLIEQFTVLEREFQKTLRGEDAGLPLPTPEPWKPTDIPYGQDAITPEKVITTGEWQGTKHLLLTGQSGASISFPFKGRFLRLVAMAHPNARENIRVTVTLSEKPCPIFAHSSLLHEDARGQTTFELNKTTGIYDLIHSEHELNGTIKFQFVNAFENGVVFYQVLTAP